MQYNSSWQIWKHFHMPVRQKNKIFHTTLFSHVHQNYKFCKHLGNSKYSTSQVALHKQFSDLLGQTLCMIKYNMQPIQKQQNNVTFYFSMKLTLVKQKTRVLHCISVLWKSLGGRAFSHTGSPTNPQRKSMLQTNKPALSRIASWLRRLEAN